MTRIIGKTFESRIVVDGDVYFENCVFKDGVAVIGPGVSFVRCQFFGTQNVTVYT